ncbi:MAG: hypothetical protein R3282_10640 [Rhodothermales bacterium]|nr:hypothetical protein [Rhodothermales bacterium]
MTELVVDTIAETGTDAGSRGDGSSPHLPLHDNELTLQQALGRAEQRARAHWSEWLEFAEKEVEGKLDALLGDVADKHSTELEQFVTSAQSDPSGAAILEYRRAVERTVVKLLEERLQSRNIGRAIQARFDSTIDAVSAVANEIPESIRLSQPVELFEPSDDDGLIISIRKLGRRRRLRLASASVAMRNRVRSIIGRDEIRPVPPSRTALPEGSRRSSER